MIRPLTLAATLAATLAFAPPSGAEEARGHIRWLRPDYQNPQGRAVTAKGEQAAMDIGPTDTASKAAWPKALPEQIAAVRAATVRHALGRLAHLLAQAPAPSRS